MFELKTTLLKIQTDKLKFKITTKSAEQLSINCLPFANEENLIYFNFKRVVKSLPNCRMAAAHIMQGSQVTYNVDFSKEPIISCRSSPDLSIKALNATISACRVGCATPGRKLYFQRGTQGPVGEPKKTETHHIHCRTLSFGCFLDKVFPHDKPQHKQQELLQILTIPQPIKNGNECQQQHGTHVNDPASCHKFFTFPY